MPNWKKVVISGSNASLNSLIVSSGVTGSFLGSLTGTATTASFATTSATASYLDSNTAYIGDAFYQTKNQVATSGTSQMYTFSNLTYSSGFIDYTINDGTNARSGQVQIVYLSNQVRFNETATMDIGNTDDFVWDVDTIGNDVNVNSVVAAGTWTVKLIIRLI